MVEVATLSFTCVKQGAGTISSKGNDDESDTYSDTNQTIATSVEDSTDTNYQSSCEGTPEHRDTKTDCFLGKANTPSVHSPPLVSDSPTSLTNEQKIRLRSVLNYVVMISGNGGANSSQAPLPTLQCRTIEFVNILLQNLAIFEIRVCDVRLYGGAASHVISDTWPSFNDIDVLIHTDFKSFAQSLYLDGIKSAVLKSLRGISSRQKPIPTASILDDETLASAYIAKMYRNLRSSEKLGSDENNIFSLFSFNAIGSRKLDIMFVHTLNRQYLFSINSWQIDLSNFTSYCLYPDIFLAFEDMNNKHIRVVEPEAVRGGCFLAYGYWLHRGYMPPSGMCDIEQELLLLKRFVSDFSDQPKQNEALVGYLENHLESSLENKIKYLKLLDWKVDYLNSCRNLPYAASTFSTVIKSKLHEVLNQQNPCVSFMQI